MFSLHFEMRNCIIYLGDCMNTAKKVRIGAAIRKQRKAQGLTLEALGEKMGISGSLVGQYERGVVNPKYETILRFAEALNVEPREILGKAFMDVIGPEEKRALAEADELTEVRLYYSGKVVSVTAEEQLMEAFSELNVDGKRVAIERVRELTDIPKYRIYRNGTLDAEVTDASEYYQSGMVGFLIGCSFSFEEALMRAGIEVRHIAMGRNVPMYKTNIMTKPCGPFSGPTVCSMRPMTPENAQKAYAITEKMPNVHGAPVHMGDGAEIGIRDIMKPDYGDAVDLYEGEIPVFWPCGVTPQAAVEHAKPPVVITHAPGHMFITDIKNSELNGYLETRKRKAE